MPARKVTVQFGLLSIPAKLEKATETKPSYVNMCEGQPGHDPHPALPVKMPKTCAVCDEIVDHTVLVKGVKQGSTYAKVDQTAMAEAKAEYAKDYKGVVNLIAHPMAEFQANTAPGESINYVIPESDAAAGHYQLLRKLVENHPELAFASLYTPVSATNLFWLTVREGVLVLQQRVRTQELKPVPSIGGDVNDQLFGLLEATLEATPYDPAAYEDKYAVAVQALADAAEVVTIEGAAAPAKPVLQSDDDLLAKLQALAAS